MNDDLLALADLDESLVRLRHAVAHPPSLPAHEAALVELRGLRAAKLELDAERVPLAERAAVLERDAATARDRAQTIAARLATATGAGRELEAMAEERDSLVRRASHLDDELLELLELLEPLDARDASLLAAATEAAGRRDELGEVVRRERAAATEDQAAAQARRPSLAAAVEPGLLARYEAIAARAGGVGAARLVDGRCGACRVTVPSALADHLAHDPSAIEPCDECGRLLVA